MEKECKCHWLDYKQFTEDVLDSCYSVVHKLICEMCNSMHWNWEISILWGKDIPVIDMSLIMLGHGCVMPTLITIYYECWVSSGHLLYNWHLPTSQLNLYYTVHFKTSWIVDTPLLHITDTLPGPNWPKHIQFYLSSADSAENFLLQIE